MTPIEMLEDFQRGLLPENEFMEYSFDEDELNYLIDLIQEDISGEVVVI